MDILYEVTFKSRFRFIWGLLIYLFLDILFIFYAINAYGKQDLNIYITAAVIVFLIIFIPTIYVHVEYIIQNWKDKLIVDPNIIRYIHKREEIIFRLDDISLIEQYKTPPLAENRLPWVPWATYNYVIITLNDKRKIIITCFLVNELEINIQQDKIKLKKVLFPYIRR